MWVKGGGGGGILFSKCANANSKGEVEKGFPKQVVLVVACLF